MMTAKLPLSSFGQNIGLGIAWEPDMFRGLALAVLLLLSATATALADVGEDCDKGSGDIATRGCTELIRRNPRNASAYYNRGFEYNAKGDLDRAIADYTKAIEIDPKFAMAYNNRGDIWR
jgi:tetratricopeptide (TPR) repeat protein